MIAAMAMAATMAVPAMSFSAGAEGAKVSITGLSESVERTFEVYQVFTGTYNSDEGTFSEMKWGSGVTSYDGTAVAADTLVADSVLENLGDDARAIVEKLALSTVKKEVKSTGDSLTIDGLADGYYVIKDVTNMDGKDDANSAWIVQVAAAGKTTEIAVKKQTPSVDKQVQDEAADKDLNADADGWGESADHAINETFQFKLTATIPADDNYAAYDSYKLVFNDTMSEGVTFEDIESVTITSATLTDEKAIALGDDDYDSNATEGTANLTWSLTIEDVKALVNADEADIFGKEDITVEVIYNAHLNENAKISTASGNNLDVNNNKVQLQYSNNPDNTGTGENDLGETPEDYVWVFTYGVENTKYKISADEGNELEGAGFTLYADSAKTTAIKLIDNGDGTYTVADQNATSGTITEMTSNAAGIFNIKGLDAGTYYLSETSVPATYNAADDITITIGATHVENTEGTAANLTLTKTNGKNDIVDTKNSTLPSTGGIGTLMFVLCGGVAAGIAGVYLVSKKKTREEEV